MISFFSLKNDINIYFHCEGKTRSLLLLESTHTRECSERRRKRKKHNNCGNKK